MWSSAKYDFEG